MCYGASKGKGGGGGVCVCVCMCVCVGGGIEIKEKKSIFLCCLANVLHSPEKLLFFFCYIGKNIVGLT